MSPRAETVKVGRAEMIALYEGYLACCNDHRFDQLGEFVAEHVEGDAKGLARYIDNNKAVTAAFPDYHWEMLDLVVDDTVIAARVIGRGTHRGTFNGLAATGRAITVQELVMYRVADGKIAQCWGDLFSVIRNALVQHPDSP